jgi:hypothetical protein
MRWRFVRTRARFDGIGIRDLSRLKAAPRRQLQGIRITPRLAPFSRGMCPSINSDPHGRASQKSVPTRPSPISSAPKQSPAKELSGTRASVQRPRLTAVYTDETARSGPPGDMAVRLKSHTPPLIRRSRAFSALLDAWPPTFSGIRKLCSQVRTAGARPFGEPLPTAYNGDQKQAKCCS